MASEIDWLQWFILWVCIIFGALIVLLTIAIGIKFRHRPGVNDRASGPTHSTLLEVVWTVIPAIIVLVIAIWGFQGFMKVNVVPQQALEIQVEGYKWGWIFTYPNGYQDNQLHIPKDVPVRLVLSSRDVIHSLYMRQFRIKKDVVPGRYNKIWVEATAVSPLKGDFDRDVNATYVIQDETDAKEVALKSGEGFGFDIFCAEYCGTNHSQMLSKVHVHPTMESYDRWLIDASDPFKKGADPIKIGSYLAKKNGCLGCHSINDQDPSQPKVGPSWVNMIGHEVKLTDGSTVTADENYIRDSIHYPQKQIVAGYGAGMPSFLNLSDREIDALTRYMKSLSDKYKNEMDAIRKPIPAQGTAPQGAAPQGAAK